MLQYWGKQIFCYWLVLIASRSVLLFLSDGYVRYITTQYNLEYHTPQGDAPNTLLSGVKFHTLLSICIIGAMGIGAVLFPQSVHWLFGTTPHVSMAIPLVLYCAIACIQNTQRMYAATKEAKSQTHHNILFELLIVITETTIISLMVINGAHFTQTILTSCISVGVLCTVYLRYLSRTQRPPIVPPQLKTGFVLFKKASNLYLSNFFERISTDGIILLLSAFQFDKGLLAAFGTTRTIINTPILAENLILNAYTPELQKRFALRHESGLSQLIQFIKLRMGVLLGIGIVIGYPLYQCIFETWTQRLLPFDNTFFIIMLLFALASIITTYYQFLFKGLNALKELLIIMSVKAICITIGIVSFHSSLINIASTLLATELLAISIVAPVLAHNYWQKTQLHVQNRAVQTSVIYTILAIILYALYLHHTSIITCF